MVIVCLVVPTNTVLLVKLSFDAVIEPRAAKTLMRGNTLLLRVSVTDVPVVVNLAKVLAGESKGLAPCSIATAAATCGVACEVPLIVIPAAVISEPGANTLK